MSAPKKCPSDATTATQRRRRTHKKSRRGCSSCKLRRVKCDETRPKCKQCEDFGVSCAYDVRIEELLFKGEGSFDLNDGDSRTMDDCSWQTAKTVASSKSLRNEGVLPVPSSRALCQSSAIVRHANGLPSPPASDGEGPSHGFGVATLEVFKKFNERTVLSVGTAQAAKIYQKEVFRLACCYPFLEDIVITLTLLHDRQLAGRSATDRKVLSHWCHGTAKFKETLMQPLKSENRDALWASAALLSVIQFAAFEPRTPNEAWPLRPNNPSDLDWLTMSDGKKAVFAITDPMREDSVFHKMSIGHDTLFRPVLEEKDHYKPDAVDVTCDFSDMFGLDPTSNIPPEHNPYYKVAMRLVRLLHINCDCNNILEFLGPMVHMTPELKSLLHLKDAKALLLVAYWYAKLYRDHWWLYRRGLIEGQAICLFLERYHGNDVKLQRMLRWPKVEFGSGVAASEGLLASEWSSNAATVLCVV